MIPLIINDKKLQIPTNWNEVTFKQYLAYIDLGETKFINAVALFTGIHKDVWEQSKEIQNFYLISQSLSFLEKEPKINNIKNPGIVEIKGKKYKVPKRLEQYTVKQFEDMRGLIRKETKGNKELTVKVYPQIVSIYFCTLIFKEYTIKNIRKTERLIEDLTMYEVIGIGNFFLKSLTELLSGIHKGKNPLSMIVKKLTQVFGG